MPRLHTSYKTLIALSKQEQQNKGKRFTLKFTGMGQCGGLQSLNSTSSLGSYMNRDSRARTASLEGEHPSLSLLSWRTTGRTFEKGN